MVETDQIDVIAQVCMEANDLIQESGTDMMKTLMRVLVLEVGQQVAREQASPQKKARLGLMRSFYKSTYANGRTSEKWPFFRRHMLGSLG